MLIFLGLFALLLVTLALVTLTMNRPTPQDGCTFHKKALLTENEKEFYTRLRSAVPELDVMCQVCMGALLIGKHASGTHTRARMKFAQKIVDFVLLDKNQNVVLLIELDDKMHDKQKDKQRDQMTDSAGYQTLRFESRNKPTVAELRKSVLGAISSS